MHSLRFFILFDLSILWYTQSTKCKCGNTKNRQKKDMEMKVIGKIIGMRTIKTLIAVYICILIGFLRGVLPFYSAISAVLCIKKEKGEGHQVGRNRIFGTLIGGMVGLVFLVLLRQAGLQELGAMHLLIVPLGLIPVIYLNVHFGMKEAVFISCVVFLSVTITHGGEEAPYLFAVNRMIDTIIGVLVAWLINHILPMGKEE